MLIYIDSGSESSHFERDTKLFERTHSLLEKSTSADSKMSAGTARCFTPLVGIHVMMNMYWEPLDMAVPIIPGRRWARVVDTSLPSPSDIADPGTEMAFSGPSYSVNGRSIVILVNKPAQNS
jgi:glycogen operon protein